MLQSRRGNENAGPAQRSRPQRAGAGKGDGALGGDCGPEAWQTLIEVMRWIQVRSEVCLPLQRRLETVAEARRFPAMMVI
jgi:hypothetical protein